MKIEISVQVFENISNIKFHQIRPPAGAELLHAERQTDGHDTANSRFLQFIERA
jgi:hypothetical protein